MDATQIVAVSIGGFLVLLLLFLVFWRRNLTAAEYTFSRIVLALAVACVAVVLTGFLKVEVKGYIQAGGSFAVFVIVFFKAPASLQGTNEWQHLRELWRDRRDLNDKSDEVNGDDVAHGLNAVNGSASAIEADASLIKPFQRDYGKDYCTLYGKLLKNRYPMAYLNSTSDAQLTPAAKKLAGKISCPV